MSITYGKAKHILAKYAGRGGLCADADETDIFIIQVLQYLLYSGQFGNLRKFNFHAVKGCFTVPYELDVPIKLKIDGEVGQVWDKWFEWHTVKEWDNCLPASKALFEDPNTYPIVYDLPSCGSRVGCVAFCEEDAGAFVIVQGLDLEGKEVYSEHLGERFVGEYLTVKKGVNVYTRTTFSKVTHVTKSITRGYVQLIWVRPEANLQGFLADYSPLTENPEYRRFKITTQCSQRCIKVSVFGRIRLKENYADNDYIPFDNIHTLETAGQALNSRFNNKEDTATSQDKFVQTLVTKENEFRRVENGAPPDVFIGTSGGSIKNIIGGGDW